MRAVRMKGKTRIDWSSGSEEGPGELRLRTLILGPTWLVLGSKACDETCSGSGNNHFGALSCHCQVVLREKKQAEEESPLCSSSPLQIPPVTPIGRAGCECMSVSDTLPSVPCTQRTRLRTET